MEQRAEHLLLLHVWLQPVDMLQLESLSGSCLLPVHVSVCVSVHLRISAGSCLCCVWGEKKSLPTASLLMLLVAPRWDAEAVWERKRERRKRCMWEQGRDNGKGDYLKGPLAPSININQSEMHGCVNDSIEPARVRACTRVCLYETCNKREENKGQIYLHEIRRLPVCVLCSFRVFLVCIKLLPEKFTTRHLHTQRYRVNAHIY